MAAQAVHRAEVAVGTQAEAESEVEAEAGMVCLVEEAAKWEQQVKTWPRVDRAAGAGGRMLEADVGARGRTVTEDAARSNHLTSPIDDEEGAERKVQGEMEMDAKMCMTM